MSKNIDENFNDEDFNDENFNDEDFNDEDFNEEDIDNKIKIDEEINNEEINNEEINNEEINNEEIPDTKFEILFKNNANKHKLEGTHSLKRDTIFMGKEEEEEDKNPIFDIIASFDQKYEIEKGSTYEAENRNNENYLHKKQLCEDIYKILESETNINFIMNRRKPNRQTFNNYYKMCIDDLNIKYTKSEIFVELSYYFTDNIFNMYKLLFKKNASDIIIELKNNGYLEDIGNIEFI